MPTKATTKPIAKKPTKPTMKIIHDTEIIKLNEAGLGVIAKILAGEFIK